MIISLIAAHGKNRELGLQGGLPWRLREDLKRFKKITLNHNIIMGRKTYQSLGIRKPLPDRVNLVISRDQNLKLPGAIVFKQLNHAINYARERGESEVFIIGGGEIYDKSLEMAHRLYLTVVDVACKADTYFPYYQNIFSKVVYEEAIKKDQFNQYDSVYRILER